MSCLVCVPAVKSRVWLRLGCSEFRIGVLNKEWVNTHVLTLWDDIRGSSGDTLRKCNGLCSSSQKCTPESKHEDRSDKPRLKDSLRGKQPVIFKKCQERYTEAEAEFWDPKTSAIWGPVLDPEKKIHKGHYWYNCQHLNMDCGLDLSAVSLLNFMSVLILLCLQKRFLSLGHPLPNI